jgi:MFS family permease
VLIASRAVQGLGAAIISPAALAIIMTTFDEGAERNKALGIWGAIGGGGAAVGVLAGGVLTKYLGWEWIFFVNVPIGLAALVMTETKLVNVKATDPQPIDWGGLVTFSAALFALIFGLIRGNAEGWSSPQILASLIAAVVLLLAFVGIQMRSRNAMLDLSLFRKPAFAGVSIVAFALSASEAALFRMSRVRANELFEEGRSGAKSLLTVVADSPAYLAVIAFLRVVAEATAAVLVTLAEEMPVNEAIELEAKLSSFGIKPQHVVCNQVYPQHFAAGSLP